MVVRLHLGSLPVTVYCLTSRDSQKELEGYISAPGPTQLYTQRWGREGKPPPGPKRGIFAGVID